MTTRSAARMSAADAPVAGVPRPGVATLLGRTGRAEWSRMWTVRSSWWFALATALVVVGVGTILGVDVHGDPPSDLPDGTAWLGGQVCATFGLFGVLVMALVNATADHGTGGIVPTLQWTPRRGVLLAARGAVIVVTTTVLGLLLVTAASAVVYAFAPAMGLPAGEGARVLGMVGFVYAAGGMLAVGLGLGTRSTAGGLVTVLALMLVLPMMLPLFPYDWSQQLAALMPGSGALFLLTEEGMSPDMTQTSAGITLAAWAVTALTVGGARLLCADADR